MEIIPLVQELGLYVMKATMKLAMSLVNVRRVDGPFHLQDVKVKNITNILIYKHLLH